MPFSKVDNKKFKITPLGAAMVEAMPNKKLMNKIQKEYMENGKVPKSKIFPEVCKHCGKPCTKKEGIVCDECYSQYTPAMLSELEE